MPVSYRILVDLGLVYVRYTGTVSVSERSALFKDYLQHPDCRPGQKHFVDLSQITDVKTDHAAGMRFQALKAEYYIGPVQTMVVYFAPTLMGQTLAEFAIRSWDNHSGLVARVFDTQSAALNFLGVTSKEFEQLLSQTD